MAAQSSHYTSSTTADTMDYEMNDEMPSTSHAGTASCSTSTVKHNDIKQFIGHAIPTDFLMKSGLLNPSTDDSDSAEPLYQVNSDGSVIGIVASIN